MAELQNQAKSLKTDAEIKKTEDYRYLVALGQESKSYEGFYAVASSVRNRVKKQGKSYKQVVTQEKQYAGYSSDAIGNPCNQEVDKAAVDILKGGASSVGDSEFFFGRINGYDLWYEKNKVNKDPIVAAPDDKMHNVFYEKFGSVHNKQEEKTSDAYTIYDAKTRTWYKNPGGVKSSTLSASGGKATSGASSSEKVTYATDRNGALSASDISAAIKYNRNRNQAMAGAIQVLVGLTGDNVDTIFGGDTVRAIAKWQAQNALKADGKFGEKSEEKAGASLAEAAKKAASMIASNHGVKANATVPAVEKTTTAQAASILNSKNVTDLQKQVADAAVSSVGNVEKKSQKKAEPAQAEAENENTSSTANVVEVVASATAPSILNEQALSDAMTYNVKCNPSSEFIKLIQKLVGANVTGKWDEDTCQYVAQWQKNNGLKDDGKFGSECCKTSNIVSIDRAYVFCNQKKEWGLITDIEKLTGNFKTKAKEVVEGLRKAGIGVEITATLRSKARAAFMHYARNTFCGEKDIAKISEELLKRQYGVTVTGTREQAEKAVKEFKITNNGKATVSLTSNHLEGRAIDMELTGLKKGASVTIGNKTMTIQEGNSQEVMLNETLKENKYEGFQWSRLSINDRVHWSPNGK